MTRHFGTLKDYISYDKCYLVSELERTINTKNQSHEAYTWAACDYFESCMPLFSCIFCKKMKIYLKGNYCEVNKK
jgi:hypothetical protein